MSFFKKSRSGGSCGDYKKGGGIMGVNTEMLNPVLKIKGAGEVQGYDQNVVRRSGAKL